MTRKKKKPVRRVARFIDATVENRNNVVRREHVILPNVVVLLPLNRSTIRCAVFKQMAVRCVRPNVKWRKNQKFHASKKDRSAGDFQRPNAIARRPDFVENGPPPPVTGDENITRRRRLRLRAGKGKDRAGGMGLALSVVRPVFTPEAYERFSSVSDIRPVVVVVVAARGSLYNFTDPLANGRLIF